MGTLASWLWKKLMYDLIVALHHLDGEVMVVPLILPARGVLSEECFSYLLKVVEGARWQRTESI